MPSSINPTGAASNTTTNQTDNKTQALGQDQFLTLLVAQLQHQDPLNPADATQFTSQLAQYSQLEQLFNLNSAMKQLTDAQGNSERISSLDLIGKEVVVEGSSFNLGDEPAQIGYKIEGAATALELQILDNNGKLVTTLAPGELSPGNHFLAWEGVGINGEPLPSGVYTVVPRVAGASASVSTLVRSEVTGVDLSGQEPIIITPMGDYLVSSIYGAYGRNPL